MRRERNAVASANEDLVFQIQFQALVHDEEGSDSIYVDYDVC